MSLLGCRVSGRADVVRPSIRLLEGGHFHLVCFPGQSERGSGRPSSYFLNGGGKEEGVQDPSMRMRSVAVVQ